MSRDPVHAASRPIEQLESRELLAVFSMNSNVADGAVGSLRAAVQNANANQADDTIYLAPGRYVLSLDNSIAETIVGDRGDLDVTESGKSLAESWLRVTRRSALRETLTRIGVMQKLDLDNC